MIWVRNVVNITKTLSSLFLDYYKRYSNLINTHGKMENQGRGVISKPFKN